VIRVALVDDQTIVRTGLARILSPADGFEVVAECRDGEEAVATVPTMDADVVLMDVRMPRLDGIEATRRLRSLPETPPVLILTTFDEDELLWGRSRPARAGSCSRTPPPKSSSPG
jgi:DNA-binding NarL/FixJ family response regulator